MSNRLIYGTGSVLETSSGRRFGRLTHALVKDDTSRVAWVAARRGGVQPLIPTEDLEEANGRLRLRPGSRIDALPPLVHSQTSLLDATPTSTMGTVPAPDHELGAAMTPPVTSSHKVRRRTEAHDVPVGAAMITFGSQVVGSHGGVIGRVSGVMVESEGQTALGLIVKPRRLTRRTRIVPWGWVAGLGQTRVHLKVDGSG